jgi:putative phage-type endonuclease
MLTDKQKLERKLGIGGSDVGIILGLSNYKTPLELFLEKTSDELEEWEETPFQHWGHALEPVIRNEFATRHNVTITEPDTIIHPVLDFMRANIDGYIEEWDSILEVKCSSQYMNKQWGDPLTEPDKIPMAYLLQVAHYCITTNAKEAHIAVLIGGNDYREFKYTRDDELENYVIDVCSEFWKCVQTGQPPAPINEDDVKWFFPQSQDKSVEAIDSIGKEVAEMSIIKQQITELTELQNEHKFKIIEHMKEADCLVDSEGNKLATWKSDKNGKRRFNLKI